jgi:hypothetical protein
MKDKKPKNKQRKDKKNKDKKNKDKKNKTKQGNDKRADKRKKQSKEKHRSKAKKAKAKQKQLSGRGHLEQRDAGLANASPAGDVVVGQSAPPTPNRPASRVAAGEQTAATPKTKCGSAETTGQKPHYHVFLSHNSRDKPAVEPLAVMLRQHGLNPFLDKWNLIPGQPVDEALVDALEHSDSAVIFVGPDGDGPWQSEEMRDILKRAVKSQNEFRAIPVLLPGASAAALERSFLGSRLWIEFQDVDDDDALLRLAKAIQGEAYGDESFKLPDEPAPYRGLERFERIENPQQDFFFGRDDEIRALVDRLVKDRFVAVIGASGSGKSSLIRAGLTKQLAEEVHPGIRRWQTLTVEPGSTPFRSLAVQVAVAAGIPVAQRESWIEDRVQKWSAAPEGVRTSIETLFADATEPLLLFIDQFEELFTHRKPGEQHERIARNFVANLADLWKNGGDRVRVILSLRADFVERCLEIGPLKELLQDRTMLVGEVGDDALREIVKQPAARVGAFLEKGLMERILMEVHRQSGSLPLLQQALHELWKHRKGAWLTHEAFDASGGVARALNDQAQAAYQSLDDEQQKIADGLFPRLISLGEGVPDTRRRVRRKELYPQGVQTSAVNEVIDKLSSKDARILVTSREAGGSEDLAAGEDFVEFTHEALLGNWEHLVELMDSEREGIRKHRVLTTLAQEWDAKPADERHKFLLRAGQLLIAEQWATAEGGYAQLNQVERNFLDESVRQRQAEEAHQAKIARRLKLLSIGATAAAVVAIAVSLYAFDQQGKADAARSRADTNRGWARELMSDFVPEISRTTDLNQTELARSAIEYFDRFAANHRRDDPPSPLYADAKYAIGGVHAVTGKFPNAETALKEAGAWQYHLARHPDKDLRLPLRFPDADGISSLSIGSNNEALAHDLGYTLNALGHSFRQQGHELKNDPAAAKQKWRAAKEWYSQAATIRKNLADRFPRHTEYRLLQASALMNIGLAELNASGPETARKYFDDANQQRQELLRRAPTVDKPVIQWHVAVGYHNYAVMLQSKDREEAIAFEDQAIEIYQRICAADFSVNSNPQQFLFQADRADCYQLRGRLALEQLQGEEFNPKKRTLAPVDATETTPTREMSDLTAAEASKATEYFEQAAEICRVLCDKYPLNRSYRNQLTDVSLVLRDLYQPLLKANARDKSTVKKLRDCWVSINDNNRRKVEHDPSRVDLIVRLKDSSVECAVLSTELGEYGVAREQLDKDMKVFRENELPITPEDTNFLLAHLAHCYAKAYRDLNEPEAIAKAREANNLWCDLMKANPDYEKARKSLDEKYAAFVLEENALP